MNILIIGLGTIGAIHGYLFSKASHNVDHLIRDNSIKADIKNLEIDMLDGRLDPKGAPYTDKYAIRRWEGETEYDLIFASVPCGAIKGVADELDKHGINGPVLLACGTWSDRASLEGELCGRRYILGYPVAGGSITGGRLSCCVLDHFMLERPERAHLDPEEYEVVEGLFADCKIKLERPHDMVEWIWLRMAINAAVISVAGEHGDITDTSASAEKLMGSTRLLGEAVQAIRETARIVESRGVNLHDYRDELLAYRLPVPISAPIMRHMFASNVLTRRIMTLHDNPDDLLFVCRSVYDCGKANGVQAPTFYSAWESIALRL